VRTERKQRELFTSYHVHSQWSDGTETIAEVIAGAARQPLLEIGISDHLVMPPNREPVPWSIPPHRFEDYLAEIVEAGSGSRIPVRVGVEVDFFPEQMGTILDMLTNRPIDYLIGSVHFVDGFPVDESAAHWEALHPADVDNIWRGYWRRVEEMARTHVFHLAGHLDLPKKFAFQPSQSLDSELCPALDAIRAAGMTIELNTSGWDKPCREAYPSEDILTKAIARGIPIMISADAHRSADLTNHFARAAELLNRLGASRSVRIGSPGMKRE
jgi:histidinol-phosphatase (PHP family)